MSLDAYIAGLPKAELHLHIEGSLEPELMFELARRNGVAIPYDSVEAVRAAYDFSNLQDFLDIYYQGAQVLLTAADFHDLAMAYFRRIAADGARHAEIFFDPQTHTDRGVPFAVVIEGLLSGMDEAEQALGVTSKLILCFLRLHTLFRSIACKIFRFSFYTDHTDRIVIQGIGRFLVPQDFHACIFEAFYQFLISLMINLHILMVAQHTAYRCQL